MTYKARLFKFFGLPPSLLDLGDTAYGVIAGSLVTYTGYMQTGKGEADLFGGDCYMTLQGFEPPKIECEGESGFAYVDGLTQFHTEVFLLLLLGTLVVILVSILFAQTVFWMRSTIIRRPISHDHPIGKIYYVPLFFLMCFTFLFSEFYELVVYEEHGICTSDFC